MRFMMCLRVHACRRESLRKLIIIMKRSPTLGLVISILASGISDLMIAGNYSSLMNFCLDNLSYEHKLVCQTTPYLSCICLCVCVCDDINLMYILADNFWRDYEKLSHSCKAWSGMYMAKKVNRRVDRNSKDNTLGCSYKKLPWTF